LPTHREKQHEAADFPRGRRRDLQRVVSLIKTVGGSKMKATGIVRRIDELGRIVIPKEIRRTLRIAEGDPLEIFTDRDGKIMLKKYSSINELSNFAEACAESLAQNSGHLTCIVDKDKVIAVAGGPKKEFYDKTISIALERAITKRAEISASRREPDFVPILEDEENIVGTYNSELIAPIKAHGDVFGAVVFLSPNKKMEKIDAVLAQTAAELIGKHASFGLL